MSTTDGSEDARTYGVVINDEEPFSIWLADRDVPSGWRTLGETGSKTDCLAHMEEVWTDMRPLSLREMAGRTGLGGRVFRASRALTDATSPVRASIPRSGSTRLP